MFKITQSQINQLNHIISKNNSNFNIKRYVVNQQDFNELTKLNVNEHIVYFNNLKEIAQVEYLDNDLTYVEKLNILAKLLNYNNWQILNGTYKKLCNELKENIENYISPLEKSSYNIYKIKNKNHIPNDVFGCVLDSKLYNAVYEYVLITGEIDYRITVAHDKKLCDKLNDILIEK